MSKPSSPNLPQLRKQAKDLLASLLANDPIAAQRFRKYGPRGGNANLATLSAAQLVIACENGFPSWPKLKVHIEALGGPSIPPIQQELDEAMIRAANKRVDLARVRRLLDAGANVNGRLTEVGTNALGWAACGGRMEAMELLLARGADVEAPGPAGFPALSCAAFGGHPEAVKLLLAHGADPNPIVPNGYGVMLDATFGRNEEVVRLLIEAGSQVNIHAGNGNHGPFFFHFPFCGETPLHYAMAYGSKAMIQALLDAGADPAALTNHGETPFHWAGRHQRPKELVKWLQSVAWPDGYRSGTRA